MAKIIYTDGREVAVKPKNGTDFSLEDLQAIVGGYIEVLNLDTDEWLVCNEEGKLQGLAYNHKATDYLKKNSRYDDFIVGNVIICDIKMIK